METTSASLRSRTSEASAASAACSSTGTSAAAAPDASASSTCRTPPRTATNSVPGAAVRESVVIAVTFPPAPNRSSPGAAARTSSSVSGITRAPSGGHVVCDLAVVEREDLAADLLSRLVSLAGDHDDVAGAGLLDRALDRRAPVELDLDVAAGAGDDLVDDRLRILAARVVRRDHRDVGELGGDTPHHRPLLAVAVAAGADDHQHPAVGEVARRVEHVRERLRLVRVVDEHRERLPLVHGLQPPRHAAQRLDAVRNRLGRHVQQSRKRDRREDVLDVEAAAQVRPQVDPVGLKAGAGAGELEVLGADPRLRLEPEGERTGQLGRRAGGPTRRRR